MSIIFPIAPMPESKESALGWVLKLSEANFLTSPWQLFKLVKIEQRGITSPAFQPSAFAPLTGIDPALLGKLSYSNLKKGNLHYQFKGQKIRATDLALRRPRICPQCVSEQGAIDAFWDIDLVTTCPSHGRKLVDRCHQCGNLLSWFRPGLLICRCGASLCTVRGEEQSSDVIELHKKIEKIAFSKMTSRNGGNCPVDLGILHKTSLLFAVRFIRALGTYRIFGQAHPKQLNTEDSSNVISAAAEIISDWPRSFHQLLNSLAIRNIRPNQLRNTILDNLADFMLTVFGPAKYEFKNNEVYLEVLRFLAMQGDGYLDPRIIGTIPMTDVKPQWVTLSAAAKMIQVDRRTLESLLAKGLIPHRLRKRGTAAKSHLLLVDDLNTDFLKPTPLLGIRKAAAYVNLPVRVLTALRTSGDFVQTYIGPGAMQYAVRDLNNLAARFFAVTAEEQDCTVGTVTIATAMRIKLGNKIAKAEILRAILNGNIRSYRPKSAKISDILVHKDDFDQIVELTACMPPALQIVSTNVRSATIACAERNSAGVSLHSITEKMAAVLLGCDVQAISGLTDIGHLIAHPGTSRRLVQRESAERFADCYICLTSAARTIGSSSRRLTRLCKIHSIPLVLAPRKHGPAAPFILRQDENRLLEHSRLTPARVNQSKSENKNSRLPKYTRSELSLRRYLDALLESDTRLPQRGSKPNLIAIAKACGFARNMFYESAKLISLLATHDAIERERFKIVVKGDAVVELKNYVADLKETGALLPRRANGYPNIFAIAKGCGLHRNAFYNNAEALSILKAMNSKSAL